MSNSIIKNKRFVYLFISIWNYGNHHTLLFFNINECQENKIKNPDDPILSFGLIKDFWKWKKSSLKNDIFTKDF